jgi:hypothetical protein
MATDDDLAKCCMLNLTPLERCNIRTHGTHLPFVRLQVVYLVGPVQPLDTIYWGIVLFPRRQSVWMFVIGCCIAR